MRYEYAESAEITRNRQLGATKQTGHRATRSNYIHRVARILLQMQSAPVDVITCLRTTQRRKKANTRKFTTSQASQVSQQQV